MKNYGKNNVQYDKMSLNIAATLNFNTIYLAKINEITLFLCFLSSNGWPFVILYFNRRQWLNYSIHKGICFFEKYMKFTKNIL